MQNSTHRHYHLLKTNEPDQGFTLLELLVVLGIIALLATVATPQVLRYLGKARTETARAQISAVGTALELYALDNGSFPSPEAGLAALINAPTGASRWQGPYLKNVKDLNDPWGQPYRYRLNDHGQPKVSSLGRDNASGGAGEVADVSN